MAARRGGKRLTWVGRIIISVVLLIVLPVLGIPAGFVFLEGWKNLDAGRWQSLGSPAEMPLAIVGGDPGAVYVRGQDGSLFECDHTGPTRDNACWKEVDQQRERGGGVNLGDRYRGEIPPPPGPVKEVLDVSLMMFVERASYLRYALLEDGSVWLWDYHADANWSLALLMLGPICGLAVAIVIVLVSWVAVGLRALLRWLKARRES
jgi:hypothetical protein